MIDQAGRPKARAVGINHIAIEVGDIDEDLETHSRDWPLHRMPAVDRAILRLGSAGHATENGGRRSKCDDQLLHFQPLLA